MITSFLKPLSVASPSSVIPPYWGRLELAAAEATSTTSTLIGLGSKTLVTTPTDMNWSLGQAIRVRGAVSTNYMEGTITSYTPSTGSMTVTVTSVGGSGTFAVWTIDNLDPGVYGSCSLWLDASKDYAFYTSGTSVVQWSDLSGYGRHMVQYTFADLPSRIAAAPNNSSVVRFGNNDSLSSSLSQLQPCTVVMVVKPGAGTETLFSASGNVFLDASANSYRVRAGGTTRTFSSPASMSTTWYDWQVLALELDGASTRLDVTNASTTAGSTVSATPGSTGIVDIVLGGGPRTADMDVAEVIVYSEILTADNKASLIQSLRTKWGIV
jgi:hypothetical protein